MNQHAILGGKCSHCGQEGLELEDECPVSGIKTPGTNPPPPRGQKPLPPPNPPTREERLGLLNYALVSGVGRVPTTREAPKRWSFNKAQNMRVLNEAAEEITRVVKTMFIAKRNVMRGDELLSILEKHGIDVKHVDQREAGL